MHELQQCVFVCNCITHKRACIDAVPNFILTGTFFLSGMAKPPFYQKKKRRVLFPFLDFPSLPGCVYLINNTRQQSHTAILSTRIALHVQSTPKKLPKNIHSRKRSSLDSSSPFLYNTKRSQANKPLFTIS